MGIVKLDLEVGGYQIENEIFCCDCITDEHIASLAEDHPILIDDLEKEARNAVLYFCDSCGKRMN